VQAPDDRPLQQPDINSIAARISALPPRCGPVKVIAVDGGAAAGKTSSASALSAELQHTAVLHTDDLLDGWDGQFGYADRLREEVLRPLSQGTDATYRKYDWRAGRFGEAVYLAAPQVLFVEGVGAGLACDRYASMTIHLDVERMVRERRWATRDGALTAIEVRWLDNEDAYFRQNPVDELGAHFNYPVIVLAG
jgi:hypothetical protein